MISSPDANVLIYASGALVHDPRHSRAQDVLFRGLVSASMLLTLQALGEFSNVAMRRYKLPGSQTRAIVDAWRAALQVHSAAETDLAEALDAASHHRLQFWDAMLWATARRVGVRYLLTEDFQDGRELSGVTFVNPFNPANDALVDRILPLTAT